MGWTHSGNLEPPFFGLTDNDCVLSDPPVSDQSMCNR